jgi:hypothetical protein
VERCSSLHISLLRYGETINDPEQLRRLAGSALLIVGSRDGASAAESSVAFSKATGAAGVSAEVYVYPGQIMPLLKRCSMPAGH